MLSHLMMEILVVTGNSNHSHIRQRDNTAGSRQSGRFLECIEDKFLTLVTEGPMGNNTLLDLPELTNKKYLLSM